MRRVLALAAIAGAILVGCGAANAAIAATTAASTYEANYNATVSADGGVSVPYNGERLWIVGDVTKLRGVNQVGWCCWPHGAFFLESNAQFTPLAGAFGPADANGNKWQPWPNFTNGDYFWASGAIVTKSYVYVYGQRIRGVNPFSVVGDAAVRFTHSLTYISGSLQDLPGTETLSQPQPAGEGWYTVGSDRSLRYIPWGDELKPSLWRVIPDAFPAGTDNVISLAPKGFSWVALVQEAGAYSGNHTIEELAPTQGSTGWLPTGKTWTCPGSVTYDVQWHGNGLISCAENDKAFYGLHFEGVVL